MAAEAPTIDVAVVGGGPAGTTTALYTTRLGHDTVLFEKAGGRHAGVAHVHNLYGVSEDVSGEELSAHAAAQLESYGGTYRRTPVTSVRRSGAGTADTEGDGRFLVEAEDGAVRTRRVVFGTGFSDVPPDVPGLERFTGRGLHYCLHCDAYGLADAPAYVLGHDDHAATVAMILLTLTADVDLLLDGHEPTWDEPTAKQVSAHPIDVREGDVRGAVPEDESDEAWLGGLRFADDTTRDYRGGFAMYGSAYNTDLAAALGCDTAEDGALAVDDRHETSVDGVYGVGDVTHGDNQTAIAMGDGARAGTAIHKDLRRYPRPPGESVDPDEVPAASAPLRERARRVREQDHHAGLARPSPEE